MKFYTVEEVSEKIRGLKPELLIEMLQLEQLSGVCRDGQWYLDEITVFCLERKILLKPGASLVAVQNIQPIHKAASTNLKLFGKDEKAEMIEAILKAQGVAPEDYKKALEG